MDICRWLSRVDPTWHEVSIVVDDPECCGPSAVGFATDSVVVDPATGELTPVDGSTSVVLSIAGDSTASGPPPPAAECSFASIRAANSNSRLARKPPLGGVDGTVARKASSCLGPGRPCQ